MSLFHPLAGAEHLFIEPEAAIVGALGGYLSLWSIYHLFRLITGKEGMGYGDFKLLAALGAWLGWQIAADHHSDVRRRWRCYRNHDDRHANGTNEVCPSPSALTWRRPAGSRCCGVRASSIGTLISWADGISRWQLFEPLKIGLTGGIASGKSTVADLFAALGVPIVDTDVIAREVVAPGEPALDEIREVFGVGVFAADGSLDRARLREIVFADDARRTELESILHPRIRERAFQQASMVSAPYVIIVVPLLFESPMKHAMDRILVVDCSEETQLRRLTERDTGSVEQALRMIAAQASREERLSIADDVISNDGDLAKTRDAVHSLHKYYLGLANQSK